jgi:CRP-like cAMP-binding protein
LSGCTKNARFAPNQYLFKEDSDADQLYLLREGKVALESHLPGKGAVKVETLTGGGVLGWSVLFAPHRWHVDCRALEPTLAFAVDGVCLRDKMQRDAVFAYAVTRRLLWEVHKRLERARLQQLDVYKAEL